MYLTAFLLGGILCALFQIFGMFTKLDPPRVLILGVAIGGLLTPFGMLAQLGQWGGAGLTVMCMAAGSAVTGTTMALLGGNPVPILMILGLFVTLTLIGIVAGLIRAAVTKDTVVNNVQSANK
ncbi:SpoVA/SpoVAEb family sporulation membrane protein [Dehalobacter sp. DCM]|uniref:SpoVA/SpoVAEb family sporulation membrane protein n=1 Tax=Dehalobacter sp. DCM TaxID=2907827 RepID=UPI0030815724|nr:SpoVA/SpoVAEb family sporulation membrane protein [Dehalobacter sp. DCM]